MCQVLFPVCCVCHFIESLQQIPLEVSIVIPVSHVWKLRHKEVMSFFQGHIAARWQSVDLNPSSTVPKAMMSFHYTTPATSEKIRLATAAFPVSRVNERDYVSALYSTCFQHCTLIHKVKTQSHTLANLRTQLLRIPASAGAGREKGLVGKPQGRDPRWETTRSHLWLTLCPSVICRFVLK